MKYCKSFVALAALIVASLSCFAAEPVQIKFSSIEVTPGLYMLMGVGGFAGGNIGLSVGEDGVVMIDDAIQTNLAIMKSAISEITDKPIDFLINTHVHFDHTGNNASMANEGARIVAHENLWRYMAEKGAHTMAGPRPASKAELPVITFSHAMSFHLNGEDARIFHVADAHTDGDAVIHFKKANVIHTGDTFFNGMFPYIDSDSGGSVDGYIAAQKKILSLSNAETKIIPGHGPLAKRKDLAAAISMLEDARNLIAELISQGKNEDEAVALNPLAKYHDQWNWVFITTEKMTRQIYNGLIQSNAG